MPSPKLLRHALLGSDPVVAVVALATLALHLALAGRYDFFRNELYFIICGRHPAFGYVDQPPLVPLLAAATQLFGESLWLLRLPAALAGAALVPLTADFARRLGGSTGSARLAACAAALAPGLVGLAGLATTESFEPLAWTMLAYWLWRGIVEREDRALYWAGLAAGLGMEAKYGMAIWLLALALGVLATPSRAVLGRRALWLAVVLGIAIALPSLVWQAVEGWPFLALLAHHSEPGVIITGSPAQFAHGQILGMNLILAPLWLIGLAAPFVLKRLAPARFLAIGFAGALAIIYAGGGKDYYLFPAYPTLFALGAAAAAGLGRWAVGGWIGLAAANAALAAPIVLPILDPPALAAFLDRLHLHPPPDEAAAVGAPLTQVFSDELGWRELEQRVAAIYQALPEDDRQHATILASNYGEAAAIDFYGAADRLPRAATGQDQYYLWGPGSADASIVIHVNGDPDRWRRLCDSVEVVGEFGVAYAMPYETNRPIFLCRGLRMPLGTFWERLKRY